MVYNLGDSEFRYKKDARAYIVSIREKYNDGQILNSQDFDAIKDAIATMKPGKRPKIQDINFIKVEIIYTGVPHKNFVIYLRNGEVRSFSIDNCFPPKNSKKNTKKENFNAAARAAIVDQTTTFKRRQRKDNGWYLCNIENREIPEAEVHVDHDNPSFKELVHNFIGDENIELDEVKYKNEIFQQKEFEDNNLKRKWQIYHQDNACLQILCEQCNLRKKKPQ
jgi:Protein of unknown function (DUF3223)